MGEKYYNVNGTPTSYDDLFKKYLSQTEAVIIKEGYQQVDKPVPTSIPTETNPNDKIQVSENTENSGENEFSVNELKDFYDNEVNSYTNKKTEYEGKVTKFNEDNKEDIDLLNNITGEITSFYEENQEDLDFYKSFSKEYKENEGRGYYSVDQGDGSVYYSDDFKRAQSIQENLFPQLEKIQEKQKKAIGIRDSLSSQQGELENERKILEDSANDLSVRGDELNKLIEQNTPSKVKTFQDAIDEGTVELIKENTGDEGGSNWLGNLYNWAVGADEVGEGYIKSKRQEAIDNATSPNVKAMLEKMTDKEYIDQQNEMKKAEFQGESQDIIDPFKDNAKKLNDIKLKAADAEIAIFEQFNEKIKNNPNYYNQLSKSQQIGLDKYNKFTKPAIENLQVASKVENQGLLRNIGNILNLGVIPDIPKVDIKETIELSEEVKRQIYVDIKDDPSTLNMLRNESLKEEDFDYKIGYYANKFGINAQTYGRLGLSGKELVIANAKSQVLGSTVDNVQKEIERINDLPFSKEEKIKQINEAIKKGDSAIAELKWDAVNRAFDNSFKTTDELEALSKTWDNTWHGQLGTGVLSFGNEMKNVVLKGYAGMGVWGTNLLGSITGQKDPNRYDRFDALNDSFETLLRKSDIAKVSTSEQYNLLNEDGSYNFNIGSLSKNFGDMLPFTLQIAYDARKGNFKNVKGMLSGTWFGKRFLSGQAKAMQLSAFRMTTFDNMKEAEGYGLTGDKAMIYSTLKSMGTAISQPIMPDVNFFGTVAGKVTLNGLVNNLKKAATRKAYTKAIAGYASNLVGELGEEEVDVILGDFTKLSMGLGMDKTEFFDTEVQKQVIAGTILLSGTLGSVQVSQDLKNTRKLVYQEYRKDPITTLNNLKADLAVIEKRLSNETNPSKKIDLEKSKKEIQQAMNYGADVVNAINLSPEHVNDEQIDLLVQKQKLIRDKQNKDSSFHNEINSQIEIIDKKIADSDITKGKEELAEKIVKGTENIVKKLDGVDMQDGDTNKVKKIINEENKKIDDHNKKLSKEEIKDGKQIEKVDEERAALEQGFIIQRADGTQTIVINNDVSQNDNAITTRSHELAHALLLQTMKKNPNAIIGLSTALHNTIADIDPQSIAPGSRLANRLAQYQNNTKEIQAEEMLTLFSDATMQGVIKFDENLFTKLGDVIRGVMNSMGVKTHFNSGRDVYNFIKDYNKSVKDGKLGKGMQRMYEEGASIGKGIDQTVAAKAETIKLSKTESDNVQQIYEQQGADGIMDILNEYKPMVNNIVNKYQNVPGFDRQMLTDEIETGKRGIFDLVREYKPETGVPLAAYINKYISARSIEAANRVLKTEFEQDISEAKGVAVKEEVKAKVDKKEKVTKKVLSKELDFNKIDKAVNEQMKSKNFKIPDSYKAVKDLNPELTAELFGVDPKQYIDPKKSLRKEDVIAARTFIRKNAELLYNLLPEALNEQGKSTGIRKLILDKFYDKTGVRKEAALGRSKQGSEVRIKKPFNKKEFLDAFGIVAGEVMKVKNQTQVSGMVSALMNETGKAMTNQAIKKNLDPIKQKEARQAIDDGKSRILFAKSDNRGNEGMNQIVEKSGSKVLKTGPTKDGREGTKKMTDFLTTKLVNENPALIQLINSRNLGFTGNEGLRALSANKKYPVRFIGDLQRTPLDKNRTEKNKKYKYGDTVYLIQDGVIADVTVVYAKAYQLVKNKGVDMDAILRSDDYKAIKEAATKRNEESIAKNKEMLDIRKKGAKIVLNSFRNLTKENIAEVREFLYHPSGKANFNLIRNLAATLQKELGLKKGEVTREHVFQAINAAKRVLEFSTKSKKTWDQFLEWFIDGDNYYQVALKKETANKIDNNQEAKKDGVNLKFDEYPLLKEGLDKLARGEIKADEVPLSDIKYFNKYVYLNANKTEYAKKYGVEVDKKYHNNPDVVIKQAEIINRITSKQEVVADPQAEIDSYIKGDLGRKGAKKVNIKYSKSVNENMSNEEHGKRHKKIDKALKVARDPNAPEKGISIFDFDQTLANTKEKVLYTMPDGTKGELTAKEFAEKAEQLELDGAEFDFKQFEKVKGATKGPFFELAQKIKGKFGNKDIFVLTARPQSSDVAIQAFLKGIGLDIKLENITGLEDGTPQAKANFVIDKVADGYNNFFFGDDAYKNVKAVQEVLDEVDVKRDVQQAKANLYESIDTKFDKIIEQNTGLDRNATVSIAKAKAKGAKRGSWFTNFYIPPSAEDFTGLLYNFLGKGKKGDADFKFFKDVLIRPFARGIRDLNAAKQVIANEYASLKKIYPDVVKSLRKESNVSGYNNSHAIRVYLWNKNGIPIPGLSKADETALIKHVKNNPDMKVYADQVSAITKLEDGYTTPGEHWMIGNISTDMLDVTNKIKRSEYLKEWKDNYDKMFTPERLNKIELIYGTKVVDALKDMQYRMEYGTNRSQGQDKITMAWQNWVNNSVGAIMFFNMRSAVLQLQSSINFINWNDNNPMKAAKAFANQKQYWKDFSFIFNHPTLKQRRAGLDIDVNASEIAARVTDSQNPISAGLNYLLQIGFTPTRLADSFAIASGGAAFYRNRVNTYLKQGLNKKQAEEKAFLDFQEISEATQQSARPDMISQQQAGPLGRLVLAFQVTPMQYARLMKRSVQDLVAGRGDTKTHISKILYYGAVQNIMFNALQQAAFALAFADDEEDEEDKMTQAQKKKATRIMNGMADTILRGLGVQGAAVATIKNMIIKFLEQEKRGYRADHAYTMIEGLNISPPIGSKARKVYSATQTYKFNRDAIKQMGFDINNPAYEAVGNVVSGTTNVPLDRVVSNINNIRGAMDKNNAAWQRIAMLLGWNRWDVNVPQRELEKVKKDIKKKKAEERKRKKNKK